MVVLPTGSPDFASVERAAGTPLTHARIGYQTWTRDLTIAAVSASTEDSEGPRDAPLRPDTGSFWEPTTLPATWTVDFGEDKTVNYVGLLGTFGSAEVSVQVDFQASVGSPASSFSIFGKAVTPDDDAPLIFLDTSRSARYMRVTLGNAGSPAAAAELPRLQVAYAGQVLKMARPVYGGVAPMPLSRDTVLTRNLSRGGQFLGQGFRRQGLNGALNWRHLTATWYRANFDPFVLQARRYPFFIAWRPETFEDDTAYAWTTEDIVPSNMGIRDFMQVTLNMHGIGIDE